MKQLIFWLRWTDGKKAFRKYFDRVRAAVVGYEYYWTNRHSQQPVPLNKTDMINKILGGLPWMR